MGQAASPSSLGSCGELLAQAARRARASTFKESDPKSVAASSSASVVKECSGCGVQVEEFAKGLRGALLCRSCLRAEDEARLGHSMGPISPEEQRGLDLIAEVLDGVSWTYWKPGEQPARILDWLYLGDLKEAMNLELLAARGITAVLNLINWWELQARLPEGTDLSNIYPSHGIAYGEIDTEDRLFFDIIGNSWEAAEKFLESCREDGRQALVNCQAGHNRSACICVCWLMVRERLSLRQAIEQVQLKRGAILSNHGFRLQLVRLALRLGRLDDESAPYCPSPPEVPSPSDVLSRRGSDEGDAHPVSRIIFEKRLVPSYDVSSKDWTSDAAGAIGLPVACCWRKKASLLSEKVDGFISQRMLSMELLACLVHWNKNFRSDYEYTSDPPTVIGNGFSGDVELCHRIGATGRGAFRCVKRFDRGNLIPDHLEKLKNEVVIYLTLEHPLIARLFDVYEDDREISLVMQYCSGGTLSQLIQARGAMDESDFVDSGVQMLRAVSYIHGMGIVHRDIKPSNFVYETRAAGSYRRVKLIDFGFSVKGFFRGGCGGSETLTGCMGTLGYLAPEVVMAAPGRDAGYTEKCDVWSLGVVFYELLVGQPAFHRERGTCDGYTEEVVLREIEEITPENIEALLLDLPAGLSRPFLRRLLTREPASRPSARQALEDEYLAEARQALFNPKVAPPMPVDEIVSRFRAYGQTSTPTRASKLAMARHPSELPWQEFVKLRTTFEVFDARDLSGVVAVDSFVDLVRPALGEREARDIWEAVCGEQDSLSYCELLAVLLPPIEDVFQDAAIACPPPPTPIHKLTSLQLPEPLPSDAPDQWDVSLPVSRYFPLLRESQSKRRIEDMVFSEHTPVLDVVRAMSQAHLRWVIVQFAGGRRQFFDYMDINRQLVLSSSRNRGREEVADACARVRLMPVGSLANFSGHSSFAPLPADVPLRAVLELITRSRGSESKELAARRVPIVEPVSGRVLRVFSCLDFLCLALRFAAPSAVLQSRAARTFDRRDTMMEVSVMHDDSVLDALRIMDAEHLTICPTTSRELSGDLGGVAAMNVISVADLKWVVNHSECGILDRNVSEFLSWRSTAQAAVGSWVQRKEKLQRFNVVSTDANDSLHGLATRLLASKLQRIFLSSQETARIVGVVSSRDILVEVMDQLLEPSAVPRAKAARKKSDSMSTASFCMASQEPHSTFGM